MSRQTDPRKIITPDAFNVAPDLLGQPLAGRRRRAGAMIVDLVLLALLVNAGGVFLALGAAIALFLATSKATGSIATRTMRAVVRTVASVILFITVLVAWNAVMDRFGGESNGGGNFAGLVNVMPDGGAPEDLTDPESEEEARRAAERLTRRLEESGMSAADRRDVLDALDEIADEDALPAASRRAIERALDESLPDASRTNARPAATPADTLGATAADASLAGLSTDSLVQAFSAARLSGDSATAARIQPHLAGRLAADTLAHLEEDLADARDEVAEMDLALDAARAEVESRSGFIAAITRFFEDLGLGFGWFGLYFTAFLALWKGQTPGKRLLRIRVIRLDGKKIGWWAAFERFGGYSAAVATGLLGFFQILWDRNQQGIHDKISETVVVRSRSAASTP